MHWIYLSPHLDDVALSVGGLLWEQSQAGDQVSIWTICAGDPPPGNLSPFAESLHARWETGTQSMPVRRAEDIVSCQQLGADYMHFDLPDCIYRRSPVSGEPLYASEADLWIPVKAEEEPLIDLLATQIRDRLPVEASVVSPLTLGDHVDHRLTRAAASRLQLPLWFYADYPYVLQTENMKALDNFQAEITPISPGGIRAWQAAVAAHQSQISTFWASLTEMRQAIQYYAQKMGGVPVFISQIWS
jgi:LmbE family N-acetylglucosaminyl deacetylase